MNIIRDYKNCPEFVKGSVVALGNFDGVHKGHAVVINKAKELAGIANTTVSVLTFEPHPLSILQPGHKKFRLTSERQKAFLMQELGVDNLFVINFDKEFSQMQAEEFISKVLVKALGVTHIVTGEDFIFGNGRRGNSALLEKAAADGQFQYTKITAVGNGEIYSSSLVRKNLAAGNLVKVREILGRNFSIEGIVEQGNQKGRTIGFPTINISLQEYTRPAFGVYAVKVHINGRNILHGAANIGVRPTIDGTKEILEVYIFDFNENIYGINVQIELIEYIRPEKQFPSFDELKRQIAADCDKVKKVIS